MSSAWHSAQSSKRSPLLQRSVWMSPQQWCQNAHMSEFSESYHLATEHQQDAVDLLNRSATRGFVFPPNNKWVSFVAETSEYGHSDSRIITSNRGTLLHYVHAEDHGWEFSVYEGPDCTTRYACRWEDELEVEDADLDLALVERLIHEHHPEASGADLETILHPSDMDAIFEDLDTGTPADAFARTLGLGNTSWVSWHYLTKDDAVRKASPGIIEVA